MKTDALAPIVVKILVGRRSANKIETDSGIKLLIILYVTYIVHSFPIITTISHLRFLLMFKKSNFAV